MNDGDAPAGLPAGAGDRCDVAIVGGGLAGLTLALQLRRRFAGIDVVVVERRSHPVPAACHKVGESSVEIGAHYFDTVLGLGEHLAACQLRKFGFRFFFSDGRRDIDAVTELGASRPLAVTSWQLDRGLFENFLAAEAQRRGIRFEGGASVRAIDLAAEDDRNGDHAIRWQRAGEPERTTTARWLVDASGRAGLLKRRLGLARDNAHAAHAVWFRIKGHIRVDDWSDDPGWRARCDTPTRWLSTNHLVGAGYWVWLIPLASGSHSVGIVADPRWHPIEGMNTFDRAMDWLAEHQPRLHDELDPRRGDLQDFTFFRRFSYDCAQVYSARRWALVGEAGRFLDPFYSPGSDFIAIGNTYVAELVARDRAGLPLAAHAQVYEQIFKSFYDSTLALYVDQYGLFGDPEVLPVKVIWDYTYYWSVLAALFFAERLADTKTLSLLRAELAQCQALNAAVQPLLRAWGEAGPHRNAPRLLDQAAVPWFAELNRALLDPLDDDAFRGRLRAAALRLRTLATEVLDRACGEHAGLAPGAAAQALAAAIETAGGAVRGGEPMLFSVADGAVDAGHADKALT